MLQYRITQMNEIIVVLYVFGCPCDKFARLLKSIKQLPANSVVNSLMHNFLCRQHNVHTCPA